MSNDHYFSAEPASRSTEREISVVLNSKPVTVVTAGGIFSPEHLDVGTAVLLDHLDQSPKDGNVLDIGCGWGPIALSLAMRNPQSTVWAIDVNERSLELTRKNAQRLGLDNVKVCTPEQVPTDIEFSGIWSNPPIRVGKQVLHEILLQWLPRLASAAEAFLVVQKNLGSDSLQRWLIDALPSDFETERLDSSKTFRVITVRKN